MSDNPTIRTNHHWRPILDSRELTPKERAWFDWLDWDALDDGSDSASFVRYKGECIYLGDFEHRDSLPGWDGIRPDSYFSGVLIRFSTGRDGEPADGEYARLGLYF